MQELISKNPILRYKLGKLIVKAAGGINFWMGRTGEWYSGNRQGNAISNPILITPEKIVHLKNGRTIAKVNGSWYWDNGEPVRKWVTSTPTKTSTPVKETEPNSSQETIVKKSLMIKKPQLTVSKEPKKLKILSSNVNTSKKLIPISNNNHYIATRGNINRYNNIVSQLGLTNRDAVRKFQMEKLGLTGDSADGIWGRNTLAAYDNYINNKVNTTNAAQIMPTVVNFATPSVNIPNNILVGSNNAANTKAFTDRLYNNTKIFKNGGLVSNNSIKRFKLGGIQKFLNAGNLPIAPKAENRYAGGKRQSTITKGGRYGGKDKVEIKQVVGKKPGIFGSSPIIRQMVLHSTVSPSYNDTTYLEIPESKNPLVERKLRGIEKHPSVFKTYYSNVYPFFGDILPDLGSGTKEEYETLKRRFNTAWNLAK